MIFLLSLVSTPDNKDCLTNSNYIYANEIPYFLKLQMHILYGLNIEGAKGKLSFRDKQSQNDNFETIQPNGVSSLPRKVLGFIIKKGSYGDLRIFFSLRYKVAFEIPSSSIALAKSPPTLSMTDMM